MSKLELVLKKHLHDDYSAQAMEELFLRLDRLHDYAAAGEIEEISPLSRAELQGWLEELIYTARETLKELRVTRPVEW
jgi:hypothetical protein